MKKLKLSQKDQVLFGVCGGIGERFGIEPWLVRVLFLLLHPAFLIYIVLAICLD